MSKVVLLDGGMGQELISRAQNLPTTGLWSAHVMMHEPDIVEQVHREYVGAGAKMLTLNNYTATPERLARDATEDLFEPLQAKAIEICKKAIGSSDVSIAGCLPPLFGSYKPETAPDFETCLKTYREIAKQQKDHVDLFLCETMASVKEITTATKAAAETGIPVWCAMTLQDGNGTLLRSGETLEAGIQAAKDAGASAVLANCSWPESIDQGLPILAASGLPFGAYANAFTGVDKLKIGGTVDELKARTDLGPNEYTQFALSWVEKGATIVGGCCEVGPSHIKHLHDALLASSHKVVRGL